MAAGPNATEPALEPSARPLRYSDRHRGRSRARRHQPRIGSRPVRVVPAGVQQSQRPGGMPDSRRDGEVDRNVVIVAGVEHGVGTLAAAIASRSSLRSVARTRSRSAATVPRLGVGRCRRTTRSRTTATRCRPSPRPSPSASGRSGPAGGSSSQAPPHGRRPPHRRPVAARRPPPSSGRPAPHPAAPPPPARRRRSRRVAPPGIAPVPDPRAATAPASSQSGRGPGHGGRRSARGKPTTPRRQCAGSARRAGLRRATHHPDRRQRHRERAARRSPRD